MKKTVFRLAANFLQKYDHKKIGLKHLLVDDYESSIKNVHFVSSRGILHSCDVRPSQPVSGSTDISYLSNLDKTWSSLQYDFSENKRSKPPATIYVCTDALPRFCMEVLPTINWSFNLVSGDSDTAVSPEIQGDVFSSVISSPHLNSWFAQKVYYSLNDLILKYPDN